MKPSSWRGGFHLWVLVLFLGPGLFARGQDGSPVSRDCMEILPELFGSAGGDGEIDRAEDESAPAESPKGPEGDFPGEEETVGEILGGILGWGEAEVREPDPPDPLEAYPPSPPPVPDGSGVGEPDPPLPPAVAVGEDIELPDGLPPVGDLLGEPDGYEGLPPDPPEPAFPSTDSPAVSTSAERARERGQAGRVPDAAKRPHITTHQGGSPPRPRTGGRY